MEKLTLHPLDWAIIVTFLVVIIGIGLRYTNQAGKSIQDFFLGGRNLPWWIAGTSMVATTFAADTPLLITELIAQNGISGNWLWWNGLIGGVLTTFFFAKMWRKANIVTDVEFVELRYSGKPAAVLRGFKSIYLGVFLNAVIIAWVNLALMSLFKVFFGIDEKTQLILIACAMLLVAIYSSLSGLLGVAITDVIQFVIAMTGCIILAIFVVNSPKVGGISGLKAALPEGTFSFFPKLGSGEGSNWEGYTLGFATFFSFVGVQWWASWYPGAEPGGGGYVAQRMMSAKSEKDAIKATLFFQLAHYALRPWPWILVGLSALVIYPGLDPESKRLGYVMAMRDYLPMGLKGLLLVAFFAAYMSTISTQLNWGSSYLVNDFFKRFIFSSDTPKVNTGEEELTESQQKQLVFASRVATFVVMGIGLFVTTQMTTLEAAFKFLIACGAGLGMVLILRWYWWRINAWSEIAATLAPFIPLSILGYLKDRSLGLLANYLDVPVEKIPKEDMAVWAEANWFFTEPYNFFITVAFTTVVWVAVTFLTKPTERGVLQAFYQKITPQGAWRNVRESLDLPAVPNQIPQLVLQWILGVTMVYCGLFFIGDVIFGNWTTAGIYFVLSFGSGWYLSKKL